MSTVVVFDVHEHEGEGGGGFSRAGETVFPTVTGLGKQRVDHVDPLGLKSFDRVGDALLPIRVEV